MADVVVSAYPAPEWHLVAVLRGPSSIDLISGEVSGAHRFSSSAAETSAWEPGSYAVSVRAVSGADIFEVESGQLTILADLVSIAGTHDPRGHAQRMLDAIEAVLEGRASLDQESYTINGRSLVRTPIAELLSLRKSYKTEVAGIRSDGRHKRLMGRKVRVRFA